jgi:hypothetical protein
LGELDQAYGWNHPTVKSSDSFIGKISNFNRSVAENIYQQELDLSEEAWRPSHPIHDKQIIEEKPESYVLIDDIDFGLQLYTDS